MGIFQYSIQNSQTLPRFHTHTTSYGPPRLHPRQTEYIFFSQRARPQGQRPTIYIFFKYLNIFFSFCLWDSDSRRLLKPHNSHLFYSSAISLLSSRLYTTQLRSVSPPPQYIFSPCCQVISTNLVLFFIVFIFFPCSFRFCWKREMCFGQKSSWHSVLLSDG